MYKIILKNKSFFDNLNDFEKIIKKDNQKDYQFFEPPDDQIINQEIEKDLFNPDFSFQRIQIFLFFDLNFPINNWKDRILALKEKYRRINFCFLSEDLKEDEWKIQKEPFCDLFLRKHKSIDEISFKINEFLNSEKEEKIRSTLSYLEKAYITFNKYGRILDYSDQYINDFFDINPKGKMIQDLLGYKNETKIVFENWLKFVWDKKILYDDALELIPKTYYGKKNQKIKLTFVPSYDKNHEIESVMCIATDATKEKNLEMIASKGQEFSKLTVEIFNRPSEFIELIQDCRHNFDIKKNYGHVDMHFFYEIIKKIRKKFDDFQCHSLAIPLEKLEYACEFYKDEIFEYEEIPFDLKKEIENSEVSLNDFLKNYEIIENQLKSMNKLEKNSIELRELNEKLKSYSKDLEKEVNQKTKDLRHALDEISQRVKDKEKQVQIQQEFMAGLGHEFRTPMNAIIGFLNLIKETLKEKEVSIDNEIFSFFDSIEKASNGLLNLVNNIMEYSQVDGGKLKLEYKIFKLNNLMEDIRDLFLYEIKRKNLTLSLKLPKKIKKYCLFDKERLRQILINLVGNAIKFTKKGKVEIEVKETLKARKKKDSSNMVFQNKDFNFSCEKEIRISIKDTGIGIPRDQIDRIFLPFEQVEGQSFETYGGTGLGLSITKGLVEALNGAISVKSEISKGSTFEIVFNGIEEYEPSNQEEFTDGSSKDITAENIFIKGSNIGLLIDSEWDRTLLKKYLQDYNLNLIFLKDEKKIIKVLKKENINLLIADFICGEKTSLDISEEISRDSMTKEIPFICLSTGEMFLKEKIKQSKYNRGKDHLKSFNSIIIKPFLKKELIYEIIKYIPFEIKDNLVEKDYVVFNVNASQESKVLIFKKEMRKITNINGLIKDIKSEINTSLDKITNGLSTVQEIEEFCERINVIAKKYNYQVLDKWSNEIKSLNNQFDIHGVLEKVEEINLIVSTLEEEKKAS